jgi:hypothetical protein
LVIESEFYKRMRKKLLKLVLFIVGVLFFTGGACPSNDTTQSNKIAQSEIYQSYAVSESGQDYRVTAFFRVGGPTGTTLALVTPSKVTFNGQTMQEQKNTSSGTFYTINIPKNTASGTFAFSDREGKTYTNKIDLAKISLNSSSPQVNGAAPVAIPLSGHLTDDPDFNLEINDQTFSVDAAPNNNSEAYLDKAKNSIVVVPAAWKKIPNGNVSLNLEVKYTIPTQQGTGLGGSIIFNYKTAPVSFALNKGKNRANTNNTLANVNKNGVKNTMAETKSRVNSVDQ